LSHFTSALSSATCRALSQEDQGLVVQPDPAAGEIGAVAFDKLPEVLGMIGMQQRVTFRTA
jgi:hypothetical protein